MKRLIAIVVLHVFLLNVMGYYGVLLGLKVQAGEQLSEMLDSDMYDLGGSVTFKIPLTVPYGVNSENYQPVSGQFEKDGVVYRMVKQRFHDDTLYIVCIKDEASSELNNALTEIAQSFAGQSDDGAQKTAPQGLIKDFMCMMVNLSSLGTGWQAEVIMASAPRYFFDSYFSSIIHPPDSRV